MRVKNPSGIIMRIAIILLCLVLFSAHLASGMFARYTTTLTKDGSGRVAKASVSVLPGEGFDTDITGNIPVSVTPSGDATYRFKVKNDSDFAIKYDILIYFNDCYDDETGDLAREAAGTYYNLKLNGTAVDADSVGVYTFTNQGVLAPSSTSDDFEITMTLKYTSSTSAPSNLITGYRIPFVILAKATQID